jgi:hypothetical protein
MIHPDLQLDAHLLHHLQGRSLLQLAKSNSLSESDIFALLRLSTLYRMFARDLKLLYAMRRDTS